MKTINKLNFELWYSDNFCQSSKNINSLIKIAVDIYKNNPDMIERPEFYRIILGGRTVATIKVVENNIIIE